MADTEAAFTEEFHNTDAGAAATTPVQCSALRKGHHVVIKGRPCKVVEMSTSKTGKHGHAKVHLIALDIFTNKKLEDLCPSTHNMQQPVVNRTEFPLLSIDDDGFASLMLPSGETKEDLKVPEDEIGEGIRGAYDNGDEVLVTVVSAMGEEKIMAFKTIGGN